MFNSVTFCMSRACVIHCLSFVTVLHICFSFIFCTLIRPLVLSYELLKIVISGLFIDYFAVRALLIFGVRTMTYCC